jgi:hypothetical protein
LIDDHHVFCPSCGARTKWVKLKVGDHDYVALATVSGE